VEQSGNINPFPPFNYPAKASLMRYSRGHQNLGCQACHESIHGLYPVSPAIDTTSYAQAAALNHDGSHGPLKCGACHQVNSGGIPTWIRGNGAVGDQIGNFDQAVTWAHTYTDEASVLDGTCQNCHSDFRGDIRLDSSWLIHSDRGRTSRQMMDKAEIEEVGHVYGDPAHENPRDTVCQGCHGDEWTSVSCGDSEWRQHLTQGRVAEVVWEYVSDAVTGTTCGW
jgi:formate-dependent nitrite reductase cytochrome c552 subunit